MVKVVKFSQEVCPKCDVLASVLEAMGKEVDESIVITDDNREEIRTKYEIMGTPTMIAFEDGVEVNRTSEIMFGRVEDFFINVGK